MPDELIPPADSLIPPTTPAQPPPTLGYAQPLPPSMLSYGVVPHRPGMITAIAVISIVLGSLGTLSGASGLRSAMFTGTAFGPRPTTQAATGASGANPSSPAPTVTPANVQAAIAAAQKLCNNRLTTAQVNALQAQLQAPGQQILTPPSQGLAPATQVTSAQILPDGSAQIQFYQGTVTIDAKGQSANTLLNSAFFPNVKMSKGTIALLVSTEGLLLALAIYLLVIGIMTLRQSPKGRKLHYIYALLKIPLTIASAAVSTLVTSEMMRGFGGPAMPVPRAFLIGFALLSGVVAVLLGCAYPIALLFALRSRTVRDYYAVTIAP